MKVKINWPAIKADFDMNSVTAVYFWKSEWEQFDPHDEDSPVSPLYFTYRFLYMACFLGAFIHNFTCLPPTGFYLLFLTNLTFALQFAYSILFFLYVSYQIFRKRDRAGTGSESSPGWHNNNHSSGKRIYHFHEQGYRLPVICKLLWILHNIVVNIPYIVTIIYWGILFNDHEDDTVCAVIVNVLTHGLNSPMALLESLVVAVPIRKTHFIFAALAGFGYATFTGLYEVFNGTYEKDGDYIYNILDWKNNAGLAAGTCAGIIFVIVPLTHFITVWGVYKLRLCLKSKCSSKRQGHEEVRQSSYLERGEENRGFDQGNKICY